MPRISRSLKTLKGTGKFPERYLRSVSEMEFRSDARFFAPEKKRIAKDRKLSARKRAKTRRKQKDSF